MNISKIILGTFVALGMSSCMNEDFPTLNSKQGTMSLNVDKLKPQSTRAVETDDFPVTIYTEDAREVMVFEKASEVPNKIKLAVGNYYAVAHTPGNLEKIMTSPYYSGKEDFEILKDIDTKTTVTCRMANGSFKVTFSPDFAQAFSTWAITIDDGSSSAIAYTSEKDGLNPAITYMTFEENVSVLNVNFTGTTTKGNRIVTSNKLTKKAATEQYDNDNPNFSGGDAIELIFRPVESTEGEISGITLKADIQFEESEETFEMEVEDNVSDEEGGDTPGDGGEEDTPDTPGDGGDPNAITLTLPADMVVDMSTDPSKGDTQIEAVNGIKSIIVKVSSTSPDMTGALADLGGAYEGIDFENGTEVVGNEGLVALFSDLGQELSVPAEGAKEYVFPIGNFFPFLVILPGDHTFTLTVTDMNGNTKDGQLTLTIVGE